MVLEKPACQMEMPPILSIALRRDHAKISGVPETIEAEVLEIDGSPPIAPAPEAEREERREDPWRAMRGRVLKLDRRWWPLWVMLGVVLLALALVVGVVAGVVILMLRLATGLMRLLTGGTGARNTGTATIRRF